MRSNFKSAVIGFAVGLAAAAAGAQAAQHEHAAPTTDKPSAERMHDMDAMMADPAMRQKMMANMAQCRDMMSMMMEHMRHGRDMAKQPVPQPKH
jgi:hypothetical protein